MRFTLATQRSRPTGVARAHHQVPGTADKDRPAPLRQILPPAGTEALIVAFRSHALGRRQVVEPAGSTGSLIALKGVNVRRHGNDRLGGVGDYPVAKVVPTPRQLSDARVKTYRFPDRSSPTCLQDFPRFRADPAVESRLRSLRDSGACIAASSSDPGARPVPGWPGPASPAWRDASQRSATNRLPFISD